MDQEEEKRIIKNEINFIVSIIDSARLDVKRYFDEIHDLTSKINVCEEAIKQKSFKKELYEDLLRILNGKLIKYE